MMPAVGPAGEPDPLRDLVLTYLDEESQTDRLIAYLLEDLRFRVDLRSLDVKALVSKWRNLIAEHSLGTW